MWLYDNAGRFYSAVQHREDPELLVVRTRVRADADHLVEFLGDEKAPLKVVAYQRSDYPWRVIMGKSLWAGYAAAVAMGVTYGNYKAHVEEVADHAEQRHNVLNRVWTANLSLEQIDRPAARWDEDWPDLDDPWLNDDGVSLGAWLAGRESDAWAAREADPFFSDDLAGARAAQEDAEADAWGAQFMGAPGDRAMDGTRPCLDCGGGESAAQHVTGSCRYTTTEDPEQVLGDHARYRKGDQ